jgi:hypothetical protein
MAWIDDLASALGETALDDAETDALLETARDIAHRVERKNTPLATFLLGLAVGRAQGVGESREEALSLARATVISLLPAEG